MPPAAANSNSAQSSTSRKIGYVHMRQLGGLRHPRRDSPNVGWHNASFHGLSLTFVISEKSPPSPSQPTPPISSHPSWSSSHTHATPYARSAQALASHVFRNAAY